MTLCQATRNAFNPMFGLKVAKAFAYYGLDAPQRAICAVLIADQLNYGHIIPTKLKSLSQRLTALNAISLCKDVEDLKFVICELALAYDKGQRDKVKRMVGAERNSK